MPGPNCPTYQEASSQKRVPKLEFTVLQENRSDKKEYLSLY